MFLKLINFLKFYINALIYLGKYDKPFSYVILRVV